MPRLTPASKHTGSSAPTHLIHARAQADGGPQCEEGRQVEHGDAQAGVDVDLRLRVEGGGVVCWSVGVMLGGKGSTVCDWVVLCVSVRAAASVCGAVVKRATCL